MVFTARCARGAEDAEKKDSKSYLCDLGVSAVKNDLTWQN
jgi:hypothetical protein